MGASRFTAPKSLMKREIRPKRTFRGLPDKTEMRRKPSRQRTVIGRYCQEMRQLIRCKARTPCPSPGERGEMEFTCEDAPAGKRDASRPKFLIFGYSTRSSGPTCRVRRERMRREGRNGLGVLLVESCWLRNSRYAPPPQSVAQQARGTGGEKGEG